ncbi:MAG: hypothetical protein DWQ06_10425 [Calditrichaeota bacterium]|nr:MAG: hypothetical protein DWQ06_10425 [Calditrichota bacterium]
MGSAKHKCFSPLIFKEGNFFVLKPKVFENEKIGVVKTTQSFVINFSFYLTPIFNSFACIAWTEKF